MVCSIIRNLVECQKLWRMPYEMFSLAHEPNKTDPEYFKVLFDQFSITADDVVYIEHTKEVIPVAEGLGIKVFFWTTT